MNTDRSFYHWFMFSTADKVHPIQHNDNSAGAEKKGFSFSFSPQGNLYCSVLRLALKDSLSVNVLKKPSTGILLLFYLGTTLQPQYKGVLSIALQLASGPTELCAGQSDAVLPSDVITGHQGCLSQSTHTFILLSMQESQLPLFKVNDVCLEMSLWLLMKPSSRNDSARWQLKGETELALHFHSHWIVSADVQILRVVLFPKHFSFFVSALDF